MKILLLITALLYSSLTFAYPVGVKGTGVTNSYPSLIDLNFLKLSKTGSTTTLTGLGAALADSLAIGGSLTANTVFDAQSTTKASIPAPKMTTAQMNAIASPLAGMQVYNTDFQAVATYNGTTWQYGFGNIVGDTVYSALVSATGVVSNLNKTGWLSGNCTVSATSQFDCPVAAGLVNNKMNCNPQGDEIIFDARYPAYDSVNSTNTNIRFRTQSTATGIAAASPSVLVCQKTGSDYTAASASAFATTNNSIEKAGTILATSGASCGSGYLLADGSAVSRTTYATLFAEIGITHGQGDGSTTFNLPDYRGRFLRGIDGSAGRDADKATRTAMATGANTGNNVGSVQADEVIAHIHNSAFMLDGNKVGAGSGDMGYAARAGISNQSTTPNTVYGGSETRPKNVYVNYCVRTTTGSTIAGSFAGYGKAPGLDVSATPNLDTFSFSYGTTNATTVCSASPCSYLDQIGTAVATNGVTRTGTGQYNVATTKTYAKLKCSGNVNSPGVSEETLRPMTCSNCNSLGFVTLSIGATPTTADTAGTILCQGSY